MKLRIIKKERTGKFYIQRTVLWFFWTSSFYGGVDMFDTLEEAMTRLNYIHELNNYNNNNYSVHYSD